MRVIVHLDADAFFASVEQAADPRLRGKPVAVGGEKRGIVASASYEARQFGVFTPMPTSRARRLCPKLIVLPGDFEKYERFSRWMFSYAYDFTPDVEISSIDEGYFDLSGARQSPIAIAQAIRRAIGQALKISVSEGIASNKLVSQVASKLHKPAAFEQVPPDQERQFLHPLPNRWLPGVGPKTAGRLDAAGLAQIGQIAATPTDLLHLLVGSTAPALKEFANGIDERPVVPPGEPAKSYSQQETFAEDQTDEEFLQAVLRRMADRLMATVRADGKSIRTATVKVRYNDMAEDQCGESLAEPTDLETDLYPRIRLWLRQAWKRRVSLRMVSLKFSGVYDGIFRVELPLAEAARQHDARRRLAAVVDELRKVRGPSAVLRGHDFLLQSRTGVAPVQPSTAPSLVTGNGKTGASRSHGAQRSEPAIGHRPSAVTFVPLQVHSYYSFLNSTLSIKNVVELGERYAWPAIALTDTANVHGAVEFFQLAHQAGIKPILGAELKIAEKPLRLYVENTTGYHHLCRFLSVPSQGRSPDFGLRDSSGLLAASPHPEFAPLFPNRFYLEIPSRDALRRLNGAPRLPLVASLPIHYATPTDRWKYEVVQSIRTRTLLRQEHPDKALLGACHVRTPAEMRDLFKDQPELLANSLELAARCSFDLPLGKPQFPAFTPPNGSAPHAFLRRLVLEGLHRRYPARIAQVQPQIEEELRIINAVGYDEYFLVVWDILQECRRRGIEWITRGSAADSLVCYCLGISDVCPIRFDLYFRRFLNQDRMQLNKLPDIDLDFPHDCKDDVIHLIFEKYGPEHCAVVGGLSTFQFRSAFAEVAKVLGVAERAVRRFTEHFPWNFGGWRMTNDPMPNAKCELRDAPSANLAFPVFNAQFSIPASPPYGRLPSLLRASPECRDLPLDEEPYRTALPMAAFLDGFPRYAKMHPCGVVLSRQPMSELTPTFLANKGYPTTHFDMDAVEAIGLVKIDILAQGGLAVMRDVKRALARQGLEVNLTKGEVRRATCGMETRGGTSLPPPHSAFRIPRSSEPWTDPAVWEMIAAGGSRAVHHIESPAMVSLCHRCNVRDIDGLIAIVSVIRPGAANEQKKVRFTRRYQGLEPVTYPHPSLERCLKSTYGMVVYEEHILQICAAFAGLSPGRADVLRRALGKYKQSVIEEIRHEFVVAAKARGHSDDQIAEVWSLISSFAGYAFCKAHSTAYGVEAYQSAWLKKYFPAEFMAAVLSNGKGFYHPLVYVLESYRLGIPLLPPWINQPGPAFVVVYQRTENPREARNPKAEKDTHHVTAGNLCRLQTPGFGLWTPAIRVPATRVKGLTELTKDKILAERARGEFASPQDFYRRVAPLPEEMEALLRVGAFDNFGKPRTAQFWECQFLHRAFGKAQDPAQGWLLPPSGTGRLPDVPLREPTRPERLQSETELLGFPVSGHPLELHDAIAWETYCPVAKLGEHVGEEVVTCGLVIEQRVHHQVTGEPMKFLTLADWTGMVETELFAQTYQSYGLATVRYPVLEITATVEPFENGRGFSLRVRRAGKPRTRK
jgi:DNA-directed DNA polymerase III PolC